MKVQKVWLVIAMIVVLGGAITCYTASYVDVRGGAQMAVSQTTLNDPVLAQGNVLESAGEETSIEGNERDTGGEETGKTQETSQAETAVSPLEGINRGRAASSREGQETDYRQILQDLDVQIQKTQSQEGDTTAFSLKTAAESELKLWEDEMNVIYNELLGKLPDGEAVALAQEQQDWMKNRELEAAKLNSKNSRAPLEGVGLTASLASLTRERAYQLADRYSQIWLVEGDMEESSKKLD